MGKFTVLAGFAAFAACGQPANGDGEGKTLTASSWDVNLIAYIPDIPAYAGSALPVRCPSVSFTMHIEPGSAGIDTTLGHNGKLTRGQLVRRDDLYDVAGPLALLTAAPAMPTRFRSASRIDLAATMDEERETGTFVPTMWWKQYPKP